MIRKATEKDLNRIVEIYDAVHTGEERGPVFVGWKRGIYPTRETAEAALERGDLFVELDGDTIVATAVINQDQTPEYANCDWFYKFPDEDIMVLHTMAVDPALKGKGYAQTFVKFYAEYAREQGCHFLRMDTQEQNTPARSLYNKLNFREAGVILCSFEGIPNVRLMCLEKKL